MKKLGVGVRVRYIGGQQRYANAVLYLLIGRTGVIAARSTVEGMDWLVEMDEGAYDIDAMASALVPIDDNESDAHTTAAEVAATSNERKTVNNEPTLEDDTFVDPAIANCCLTLWERKDGAMTNAVQLLVRPTDVRGDESGGHPGERFVMVTITREEVAAMLKALNEDAALCLASVGADRDPARH